MTGSLIEFPRRIKTSEEIVVELAPLVQTEADMQHVLSQVDPEKRAEIEACLRANGACKDPESPAC